MALASGVGVERFVGAGGEGADGDRDSFGMQGAAEEVGGDRVDAVADGRGLQGEREGEVRVGGHAGIERGRRRNRSQARYVGQRGGKEGCAFSFVASC